MLETFQQIDLLSCNVNKFDWKHDELQPSNAGYPYRNLQMDYLWCSQINLMLNIDVLDFSICVKYFWTLFYTCRFIKDKTASFLKVND